MKLEIHWNVVDICVDAHPPVEYPSPLLHIVVLFILDAVLLVSLTMTSNLHEVVLSL